MNIMTIPFDSIHVPERYRKDYGDTSGLRDSLGRIGSIHPIVLAMNDSTPILVAGGRRYACYKELKVVEVYEGSVLDPSRLGFVWKENVPEDLRKEAELDENLFRLDTKWIEDVLIIADVHALKRQIHGSREWGVEQTAALLGKGYGRTKVSHAVRLARLIRSGDKDIIDAENMSDAVAVMIKRKEDEALAEMMRRTQSNIVASTGSFLDTLNIEIGGPVTRHDTAEEDPSAGASVDGPASSTLVPTTSPIEPSAPVPIPLSRMFVCGDAMKIMPTLPESSFDHIITDIPYGIDMKNLDTRDMSDVAGEHDVEQNVSMMEPFLQNAFRLVRSGGFCVFFYDLDWHEHLQATAEVIGWKVQRWPLIWYKTHNCQNNAAQYNFTKNYEAIMVLRRDEKTVLRNPQTSSVWMGDGAAERKLYNNPFAKPFALWKWLYDAVTFTGQKVLDPFCGEMSACRAAVNCGLTPFGIEIRDTHFNRGLENMKAVFSLVHNSNVTFV
jgi:DNA modification methylase